MGVPTRAWLFTIASLTVASCHAHTDHRAGWVSGIAAQLTAPGRRLQGESDHRWDMHDPIKLYANKVGWTATVMPSKGQPSQTLH